MDIADYVLVRLDPDKKIAAFDCGNIDLNKFLLDDAAKYQKARFSVTHLLALPVAGHITEIAGYFNLLTDKLVFDPDPDDEKKRDAWKEFNKDNKIHFNKQRATYPAVKIGRLAVASAFAGKGLGRSRMGEIRDRLTSIHDPGLVRTAFPETEGDEVEEVRWIKITVHCEDEKSHLDYPRDYSEVDELEWAFGHDKLIKKYA